MTAENRSTDLDREAVALAACYRLLLQKARERRERLAEATVSANEKQETEQMDLHDGNGQAND